MKTRWYKNAVIYQIYPRSFCDSNGDGIGDIKGIVSKLDYLQQLGVNAVWLSPCYASPNDDNGYDISDYRAIAPEFGTMDDWELMIGEMHARGIRLIMDLVVNHTSNEHFWFKESCKSVDNPYRDYYIWSKGKYDGKSPPNNWTSNFLGSAWEKDPTTDYYYLHLFSKKQPDLNWDNPQVRQEVVDICNFWFDKGVDGFRCDVIPYISKGAGLPKGKKRIALTGKEHYVLANNWKKYISEINEKSWSLYDSLIVGECCLVPYDKMCEITRDDAPYLDTSFSFDHMTMDIVKKFKLSKMKAIFDKQQTVPKECWTSCYLENHDQPRSIPRFAEGGQYRTKSATMLATMNMTLRGTPYIYQGEEIGMTNCDFAIDDYQDILSKRVFSTLRKFGRPILHLGERLFRPHARDHARTPMQWDETENSGFTTAQPWMCVNPNYTTINVTADKTSEDSIFDYYRKMILLRSKLINIIIDGKYIDHCIKDNKIYQYSHIKEDKAILIQLNFSHSVITTINPYLNKNNNIKLLISNYPIESELKYNNTLRPYEAQVYLVNLT